MRCVSLYYVLKYVNIVGNSFGEQKTTRLNSKLIKVEFLKSNFDINLLKHSECERITCLWRFTE